MKYICKLILLLALIITTSCSEDVNEELYTRLVGLKAPIDGEDVSSVYLRYKPEGETTYQLPVVISGSTQNDKAYDIRIGVDNDTLPVLNVARYGIREDLFFKQLPEKFYEFPSSSCHIPAGSDVEMFEIKFHFSGLNLVDKWILPLMVEDDPSYVTNNYKGRRKALLYLKLFNDYSGKYSATNMQVYFDKQTSNPTAQSFREARVVDEKTVFFYAGLIDEQSEDRELYKIYAEFGEVTGVKEDGTEVGGLRVWGESDKIGFELLSEPTYEIQEVMDRVQPHLKHRYIVMYMKYKYNDITSALPKPNPENPEEIIQTVFPYRCEGSMLLERKINILIPDEDQAIQW